MALEKTPSSSYLFKPSRISEESVSFFVHNFFHLLQTKKKKKILIALAFDSFLLD